MSYGDYDYEDCEDEEDEFDGYSAPDEKAPALPELKLDVSQDALRHELRRQLRDLMPAAAVKAMAQKAIREILDEEMDTWLRKVTGKTVCASVEQYFTKERTVTDRWGSPAGGTEGLGDAVIKQAERLLGESSNHRSQTRIQEMVQTILMDPLEKDLKAMLAQVKKEKSDQAAALISRMLEKSMKQIGESNG